MRTIVIMACFLAFLTFLNMQFPYALDDPEKKMYLLYSVMLVALVGSGIARAREQRLSDVVKIVSIWLGIFFVLILGYGYRDVLLDNRLGAELMPYRARMAEDGSLSVRSGSDGHFFIEVEANGVPVKFMVDTGATNIVLSPTDAERIGIDTATLNYDRLAMTANGVVKGAVVRLKALRVQNIVLTDVAVTVNGAPMSVSLLGMDFLRALSAYRVEGNTLTLVR